MLEQSGIRGPIPLMGTIFFSVRYIEKPLSLLPLVFNHPARIHMKGDTDGGIVLQSKNDFWRLRDITHCGWKIVDVRKGRVYVKKEDIKIGAYPIQLSVLKESLEEYYRVFDYSNKVILDVGGYIGYSSVLFSKWGARKVIIYEAQKENIPIIRENLRLNKVNGEVYNFAVADKDGEIELKYENLGTTTVGLKGNNKYMIRGISVTRVISKEKIDIAKFDCEGCEYSLLSVPCKVLRKVPRYVIEYHRGFLSLKKKFEKCGYKVKLLWNLKDQEGIGGLMAEIN
ncbi:methyltransferase, FkbM family [Aciduliprofundum sp. MAR08-339]|uniref:FkbM family methyltransferase n=1 Tax=Aciduliprofundum sp. (strain MAR08-339) TaxID=673860 RepID=UPI0002A4931A|nr:methyltransferase, FkbM family [Aciduliprofundum sp. MAR08-339]